MGKSVLIVDDAMVMRMAIQQVVKECGYEVAGEAGTGLEAISKYEKLKPDLVTMDITMPDMNGIDAVRGIKAIHPEAKIIMVSAMGQQGMVLEAMKLGAMDFIVKPFDKERVHQVLNKILG